MHSKNIIPTSTKQLVALLAFGFLLTASGCGKKDTSSVSGSITALNPYTGKVEPIYYGHVTFHPANGKKTYIAPIVKGKFVVNQVPSGKSKVTVEVYARPAQSGIDAKHDPDPANRASAIEAARRWFPIAPHYTRAQTTNLQYNLQQGTSKINIQLTSVPQPILY